MNNIIELIGVYEIEKENDFYLFELLINKRPNEINLSLFVQEDKNIPEEDWQVAYDEHYLNDDGTKIIDDQIINGTFDPSKTRLTFFMYYEDFSKYLKTPFGSFSIEKTSPIPQRLSSIISFEPVD